MVRTGKRWLTMVVLAAVVVVGWGLLLRDVGSGSATAGEGLLRLHIMANSDSDADQRVKLKVRDEVLAYITPLVREAPDATAARQIVASRREEIIYIANQVLAQGGANYPADMEIGWFDFPVRSYGTLVLPAGKYEALRLILGQGQGSNWWCVLFPPLCLVDATGGMNLPVNGDGKSPAAAQGGKVELRWKLAELWRGSEKK